VDGINRRTVLFALATLGSYALVSYTSLERPFLQLKKRFELQSET
jgi:hypothetical protein